MGTPSGWLLKREEKNSRKEEKRKNNDKARTARVAVASTAFRFMLGHLKLK